MSLKFLTVAVNEYRTVVFSKSFLFGLLLPPILYGGMFLLMFVVGGVADHKERKLIVVDQSEVLYPVLEEALPKYNRGKSVFNDKGEQIGPQFALERYDGDQTELGDLELSLSDRVRAGEAFAFLVIGADYPKVEGGDADFIQYYSNSPTALEMPDWVDETLRKAVESRRLEAAGLDEREMRRIFSHNELERFNLAVQADDGSIVKPKKESRLLSVFTPMVVAMMLFFGVQIASPILLSSVIEEKMQRIAEVLLSSVTPTQLLWGKILAGSAVALTFTAAYMATGAIALYQMGRADYVSSELFIYFFLFLIVSLLTFGSLLAGISASCQDLKDSQNMAGSVMILMVVPLMASMSILNAPESGLAQTLSFIPPFSPMVMCVRLAIPPGLDAWEPLTALAINAVFAVFVVFGAARIFRIGILAQGKTPSWKQLLRWAMRG